MAKRKPSKTRRGGVTTKTYTIELDKPPLKPTAALGMGYPPFNPGAVLRRPIWYVATSGYSRLIGYYRGYLVRIKPTDVQLPLNRTDQHNTADPFWCIYRGETLPSGRRVVDSIYNWDDWSVEPDDEPLGALAKVVLD